MPFYIGYTCAHCAAIHGNAAVLQLILNAGHVGSYQSLCAYSIYCSMYSKFELRSMFIFFHWGIVPAVHPHIITKPH